MAIKDSGERREFETGAVRDIKEVDNGRCDLLPLTAVCTSVRNHTFFYDNVLFKIGLFYECGNVGYLYEAISSFCEDNDLDENTALLEMSVHFAEGAQKYGENNWKKGIPVHSYIDSSVRHYIKHRRGDNDERHDRAFLWNMYCCIWTYNTMKSMIDIDHTGNANDVVEARKTTIEGIIDMLNNENTERTNLLSDLLK